MEKYVNYLKNFNTVYVDDDDLNTEAVSDLLINYFNTVDVFNDPKSFLDTFENKNYDVIFLDINMPDYTGIDLVEIIRKSNMKVPIILLTAYSNEDYLLTSANLNIQAYIIKPLNFKKLFEAFNNVYAYLKLTNNLYYSVKGYKFDFDNLTLKKDNESIKLIKKESELLKLLLENKNKLVTYEKIETVVWTNTSETMTLNALRTIIKTLKKKIGDNKLIENISGLGYVLKELD